MAVKFWERTMGALVILLVCLISTAALADESYLCMGEHATGFAFKEKTKTWSTARFQENKYIVKKSTDPLYKWEVFDFGKDFPISMCENDFNDSGNIFCEGVTQFRMNKEKLRFLYIYPFGYWSDNEKQKLFKEGRNTPSMEIGTCSKI
jgi:hypothetical protein